MSFLLGNEIALKSQNLSGTVTLRGSMYLLKLPK